MRLISYEELGPKKGIRLSRRRIQQLVEAGKFPKPVPISPKCRPFVEDEIDAFVAERAAERKAA